MMIEEYATMTDEALVALAQKGDACAQDFLLKKYMSVVRIRAHGYFLVGADREDIIQEGMFGLYKAIRDYKEEKQVSFRSFAEVCITRQILTAIKMATRQKHIPLNYYVSLNHSVYVDDAGQPLIDVLPREESASPEEMLINSEEMKTFARRIDEELTPLERKVLACYLEGKSYQEITKDTGRHLKCVDNALQRVKKKMLRILEEKRQS